MLTIVMYHYVRDLRRSRFPGIKGLSLDAFEGQLEYLDHHQTAPAMAQYMGVRVD